MTTQNDTVQTANDPGEIPAGLRRAPTPATPPTEAKIVSPAVEKAKQSKQAKKASLMQRAAEAITGRHNAKVQAEKTAQPAKAAKAAKAPKEVKAAPTHKPSKVVRTDDNPAKSIVPSKFKAMYAENDDSCGDKVAHALKAAIEKPNADGRPSLDMGELARIAKQNGIEFDKYAHLNNGQKRMNVGNRLRGLLKAGKKVVIGKQTFSDAEKALAKPQVSA